MRRIKKAISQIIKNPLTPLIIFSVVLAVLFLPFYQNGRMLVGGEGSYYLDYLQFFKRYAFAWQNYVMGIYSTSLDFAYVFHMIILQIFLKDERILNFISIFSIYFLPFLAVYLLSLEFKIKPWLAFLISAFYLANPFMVNFLKSINQWNMLAAYILPAFFLIIFKFYQKQWPLFVIFGLHSLFFSFTNANPPTMVIYQLAIILFVTLVSVYYEGEIKFKRVLKTYLTVILSFFLFNLWWIANWFYIFLDVSRGYSEGMALSILRGSGEFVPAFWRTFTLTNLLDYPLSGKFDYLNQYYALRAGFIILAIPLLLIIFSIVKNEFKNKFQSVLIFSLIGAGLLANGVHGLLGRVYEFMILNLPLFSIFKSAGEKWGILFVFLLTLYFIILFKDFKRERFYLITLVLFLVYIFYNLKPYLSFNFIPDSYYKVTSSRIFYNKPEYLALRDKINQDLGQYRVLSLPGSLNYQVALKMDNDKYYTGNDPILNNTNKPFIAPYNGNFDQRFPVLFDSLSDQNYLSLLGLYNLKKIVVNKDVFAWFGLREKESLLEIEKILNKNLKQNLYQNGSINLYDISDNYYLPRFYIPDEIVYSPDSTQYNLVDILSSSKFSQRSAYYFKPSKTLKSDFENQLIRNSADQILLTGEIQSLVDEAKLKEGTDDFNQGTVNFPFARWKPGSFIYPYIMQKEEKIKKQFAEDPELSFDQHLFFAGKRIYEIQKWGNEISIDQLTKVLKRYEEEMSGIIPDFEMYAKENDNLYPKFLKLEVSLAAFRKRMLDVLNGSSSEDKKERITVATEIQEKIEENVDEMVAKHYMPTKYHFTFPEGGEYEILGENIGITNEWQITEKTKNPKDQLIAKNSGQLFGKWLSFGKRYFEKGSKLLFFQKPAPINLLSNTWDKIESDVKLEKQEQQVSFSVKETFPGVFQNVSAWKPDTSYRLSLSYNSSNPISISVIEENKEINDPTQIDKIDKTNILYNQNFEAKNKWQTANIMIKSGRYSKAAKIFIYINNKLLSDVYTEFKDIRLEEIIEPKIMLRKINQKKNDTNLPKITIKRLNPVKYIIDAKDVSKPYFLIFSESFNPGWKAYINKTENLAPNAQNYFSQIISSFFDGGIKEAVPEDILFDRNIFQTLGKPAISEKNHLIMNGYANSWYITPEDVNGQKDYQLIIEYWPQWLFYLGMLVTLATILVSTVVILKILFVTKKYD